MARSFAFAVSLTLLTLACGEEEAPPITTPGVTTNVTGLTTEGSTTSGAPAGSSTSGGDSDSGTSATSTTTGTTDAVGSSSSTTTTSTGPDSTSTTFPAPVQECLDMVDPGDECTECMCLHCLELWEACVADEWCWYLQECAQDNGCYGIDCLPVCKTPVDFAGGVTGESFLRWLGASDCMKPPCKHMCPW